MYSVLTLMKEFNISSELMGSTLLLLLSTISPKLKNTHIKKNYSYDTIKIQIIVYLIMM